jgi:hypothetical protein
VLRTTNQTRDGSSRDRHLAHLVDDRAVGDVRWKLGERGGPVGGLNAHHIA